MRIAFCLPNLNGRLFLYLARGLIARGHVVDFVLMNSQIHFPDLTPSDARLFVLNTEPDERTRTIAADHLERCIPMESRIRTTQWLRNHMHLVNTARWYYLIFPWGRRSRKMKEAQFVTSYISKEMPDCVLPSHFECEVPTFWAMKALPKFPPVIPTIHSDLTHENGKTITWYRDLLGRSEHVVTVSNGVRDGLLALTGLPPGKVSTIYNPVVTPDLDEWQKEVPAHPWMVDDGPPVVLATGRLVDEKEFPTLLKAFHILTRIRELRLIILGEGERRQQLEEFIRSLGLQDKVSLPGWTANPFALMSRASLFVMSSRFEGLGLALIEALACGCPCVSADCPSGPSEILEDGRVGSLVPVGDHVALADAMGRVLDNPPDKKMLRRRAAFFSAEKAVDAYEKLIVETVRKRRIARERSREIR